MSPTGPAVAVAIALASFPAVAAEAPPVWEASLAAALQRAGREDRQVFVDFYATWCIPCRQMQRTTFRDTAFARFARDFVCVKVDVEKDTASARRHAIVAYPTLLLMRKDGVELDRSVGALPARELVSQFRKFAGGQGTLTALLAAEDSSSGDPTFLLELAQRLAVHGRADEAVRRYRRLMIATVPESTGIPARAGLGIVDAYRCASRPSAAIQSARSWLERFPSNPHRADILLMLGELYESIGDPSASRASYHSFLESFDKDFRTGWVREHLDARR